MITREEKNLTKFQHLPGKPKIPVILFNETLLRVKPNFRKVNTLKRNQEKWKRIQEKTM